MRLSCCAEIPLPNEQARMEILKIHAAPIAKNGEIGEECTGIYFIIHFIIFSDSLVIKPAFMYDGNGSNLSGLFQSGHRCV